MKRLLHWLIGAPIALIAILLSVANRGAVTFSLDPFSIGEPVVAVDVPLFVLLFAAIFLGLLIGWSVGWSGAARKRREARRRERADAPAPGTPSPAEGRALMPRP